ncbi:MAG: histidine phosphatase family protein [Pseudomonadota bacterium]
MRYPDLLILRHGQTVWNAEGRLQGALNSPLTPLGIAQAQAQGRILAGLDLSGFQALCSPQGRAVQTAGYAVAPHVARVDTDARLVEIGVGQWSGRQRDTLGVEYDPTMPPGETLSLYEQAPGGEGLDRLRLRCAALLDSLDRPSVLVTHGITGRMIRALWLGWGADRLSDLPGGQGIVFRLDAQGHAVLRDPSDPA